MKKKFLTIAVALSLVGSTTLSSCMGSFALTKNVYGWNESVGDKFVNELVFVAFWILPVYELTMVADALIINSIEFWSGSNPMHASTQTIDTDHGKYIVECDGKGYNIKSETDGSEVRLSFDEKAQSWSWDKNGKSTVFMTFVDNSHVRMLMPDGNYSTVELSQQGVYAYREMAQPAMFAAR